MNRNLLGNMERKAPLARVNNGYKKQGRGMFILLLMVWSMPLVGWGQSLPFEVTTPDDITNHTEKFYWIESSGATGFYAVPHSDDAKASTTNAPTLRALWYFMESGESGYYYIINKETGTYLKKTGNVGGDGTIGVAIYANADDSKFKFSFDTPQGITQGSWVIYPKEAGTTGWLSKKSGNAQYDLWLKVSNWNSTPVGDLNSQWKIVARADVQWPRSGLPFEVSTVSDKHYYRINHAQNTNFNVSYNGSNYGTISNAYDNKTAWYFEEAAADPDIDNLKYYNIVNAQTGKYLKFTATTINGSNQNDVFKLMDYDGDAADYFQFVVVNSYGGNAGYSIMPKLAMSKYDVNSFANSMVPSGMSNNKKLKLSKDRNDNNAHWNFVPTEYPLSCAITSITYSSETGQITITSTPDDAEIHYTTDGVTEPSSTVGTPYSGPFAVSSTVTIKAIATKDGYNDSPVVTVSFDQVATPTIQNNGSNAISITSVTEGATIYYTTDETTPTTGSTLYTGPLTENVSGVTINAIAVKEGLINSAVGTGSVTLKCAKPVIIRSGDPGNYSVTISCAFPANGVTIYYTINGDDPTISSSEYTGSIQVALGDVIKAIATASGYDNSDVATKTIHEDLIPDGEGKYHITDQNDFETFVDMANDTDGASHHYILEADVTAVAEIAEPFTGIFDGNYHTITGLTNPFFNTVDRGTVKNVKLDNVNISTGINVGAICNEANGAAKIYNCGILSGSVSGGTNTGGLVGLIEAGSSVRVVNCYNFANVSGSSYAAGIVGKNEGTVSSDKTVGNVRIALCMMYGSVSGATNISPVYCGNHVGNVQNYTEYNFYLYSNQRDANGNKIEKIPYTVYNDQQAITEEEYLTRFPFHRHILNTHRELGAFFLFGASTSNDVNSIASDEISEIGHWVLKPDEADYPIVEPWLTNKTNTTPTYEHNNLPNTTEDYKGRLLTEMGDNGYLNVSISIDGHSHSAKLPITDMNTDRHDYTWGKVVLPFANEFEINTNYDRICTGWKITSVTKEGTAYSSYSATNYNFADRDNPQKDIYGGDNLFIFAQGGYYIVPYGVTAITIVANFANAIYLSDATYDVGFDTDYANRAGLGGNVYANTEGKFHGKTVYHDIKDALASTAMVAKNTPHEQAIVLVGNYHFPSTDISSTQSQYNYLDSYKTKAFTLMSIDADNNQEPDYAFYSNCWLNRPRVPPVRFDFVALVPMGMAAHVHGSKYYPGLPIWNPRGWFEMTETSLCWANQFELASSQFNLDPATSTDAKKYNRLIINSGYFVQMVRASKTNAQTGSNGNCQRLIYSQIGGNTYIKEYYPGSHSATPKTTTLVPVNVTGGEIEQCFMTGYGYSENAQGVGNYGTVIGDNIYFWCAGGKIGKFLGAYMEKPIPATTGGKVNMTALIDHALITEFYGGGTSPEAPITGKIDVTIKNSRVDRYCGGPEFGDMTSGETVTTRADKTTFGYFYGAGFGGTGITYYNYEDLTMNINTPSNTVTTTNYPDYFFARHYSSTSHGRLKVKNGGIGTCYKFEYIVNTSVINKLVARFYVGFAKFDLATTGNVTNTLTDCTVLYDFYGGGCQGKVDGTVTSTLTDCTVNGNAFGAGYQATANEVEVYPTTDPKDPPYALSKFTMATGIFSEFHIPEPEIFQWEEGTAGTSSGQTLYTDKPMSTLGDVTGDITLTLEGHTVVNNNVFGGGNESKSLNNATVTIKGTSQVDGNVFGGGNKAIVNQNTTVKLQGNAHVLQNVYGGGNEGPVGGNSKVIIED